MEIVSFTKNVFLAVFLTGMRAGVLTFALFDRIKLLMSVSVILNPLAQLTRHSFLFRFELRQFA